MPGWPDALNTCVSKSDGGGCKCGKASYNTPIKKKKESSRSLSRPQRVRHSSRYPFPSCSKFKFVSSLRPEGAENGIAWRGEVGRVVGG